MCDGEKDCADGSDEDGCAQLCNTPGMSHSSVPCAAGSLCTRLLPGGIGGIGPWEGLSVSWALMLVNVACWFLLSLALGWRPCQKRTGLALLLVVT